MCLLACPTPFVFESIHTHTYTHTHTHIHTHTLTLTHTHVVCCTHALRTLIFCCHQLQTPAKLHYYALWKITMGTVKNYDGYGIFLTVEGWTSGETGSYRYRFWRSGVRSGTRSRIGLQTENESRSRVWGTSNWRTLVSYPPPPTALALFLPLKMAAASVYSCLFSILPCSTH